MPDDGRLVVRERLPEDTHFGRHVDTLPGGEIEQLVVMKDVGTSDIILTTPEEDLNAVLKKFTTRNIDSLPVVAADDYGMLIGMLSRREVISFYNERILEMKGQTTADGS